MISIYTDGASRGNPGRASWAYTISLDNRTAGISNSGTLGEATNNDAEYSAIIKALEYACANKVVALRILSDSEIVIRQLKGIYRCKEPRLQKKKAIVESYTRLMHVEFGNVSREHVLIRHCDRLCNQALDKEVNFANTPSNDKDISAV